jgi:hypothetical protein
MKPQSDVHIVELASPTTPTNPFADHVSQTTHPNRHDSANARTHISTLPASTPNSTSISTAQRVTQHRQRLDAERDAAHRAQQAQRNDAFRSSKARLNIDASDGKTKTCDRAHTFDSFVPDAQLSEGQEKQKKMGHTWEVVRALKRWKKPLRRLAGRGKGKGKRERLLSRYGVLQNAG